MRILIIRNFPTFIDVKYNTYNIQEVGLAKALVRKGHEVCVVFWTKQEECDEVISFDDGLQITVRYKKGAAMLKNAWFFHMKELIASYDVIQPCEYNQIQSWYLAKKYPQKTVIYHGPYFSDFNKNYNRMCRVFDRLFLKTYLRCDSKFIVKSYLARDFLLHKGIKAENIMVGGVGMDAQMLVSDGGCQTDIYHKMHADSGSCKILYIGRLEARRDIYFLLDVFQRVYAQVREARLYMIGSGESTYVDGVFAYAKELGIYDHIIWQERAEQKYLSGIYEEADFFLLPTEYEIFGMVMLEAMYYKTVVLTTRNGGAGMLITQGESGFVFKAKDADAWTACILELRQDRQRLDAIREKASAAIREGFTWDKLAERFVSQYRYCIEGCGYENIIGE